MHTPVIFSLAASLSIGGIGAAVADSDVAVWRWYVSNALRAQQKADPPPPSLREGRASAIEAASRFKQRYERYFADGSPAPSGDLANR